MVLWWCLVLLVEIVSELAFCSFLQIRRVDKRRVNQSHREVDEEWLVLLAIDEIEHKVAVVIRPEIFSVAIRHFTVSINLRTVVATRLLSFVKPGPHAVFVEPVFDRLVRAFIELAKLPLSGDRSGVASVAEIMREGSDLRYKADTFTLSYQGTIAGPVGIQAAHDHHTCRSAKRRCIRVLEANALGGHPVQMRSRVDRAAVAGQAFGSDIVGHDDDHIWLVRA